MINSKSIIATLFFLMASSFSSTLRGQALSASEIIEKNCRNKESQTFYSEISMTVVRPTWQRETKAKMWIKTRDYSFVLLTAPAKERGQSYLKRQNNLWNWQPSIGRTIKLSSSSTTGQAWQGSDFTIDDIVRNTSFREQYTATLLGQEEVEGTKCHKLQLVPKPETPVVWKKIVTWISTKEFVDIKSEFYGEHEKLIRTYLAYDIKQEQRYFIPMRMEIVPAGKKGYKTVLTVDRYTLQESLNEKFFSLQNLKNIR